MRRKLMIVMTTKKNKSKKVEGAEESKRKVIHTQFPRSMIAVSYPKHQIHSSILISYLFTFFIFNSHYEKY